MWGFSFWPSQSSSRAESNVERYESKGEEVERLPGRELSPEDFPKLEELGIDLAPVRPFVVGSLYRLSSTDETYCKIYEEVFLGVFCDEDRDFNFQMVIAACDKVILRQNITSESLIRFVKKRHSIVWPIVPNGGSSMYSLAFVFSNDEDEHVMKSEIAIRLYEASRQERFEKAVDDASDRAWILESSNREEPEDEEDNDVEMSIDDNDEVRVVRPVDSGNNDSEKNRHLASAIKHNRAFVVRGSKVGVFKHDNDGQLDFVTSIDEIKTNNGKLFSPSKIMLHRGDRQMLMLNPNEENKVYALDLERETIVDEFQASDDAPIRDLSHAFKYAQKEDDDIIIGTNNNSLFSMDPRLHISNKRVTGVNYKTNPKLSCVVTTGDGHIAVGSDTGEIRLYSDVDKRAKTALPGLGHGVTSVDVTEDGHWILATTDRYLILAETVLENGRTGFQTRMGQHKPIPYKLQLKIEDMVKFGITDLKFTAAKFDTGENIEESWIITSTGPFIITWNFAKIKRNGRIDDYQIKRCEEEVVADQFRYNLADQVVVTMLDDITVRNRRPIHRRGH